MAKTQSGFKRLIRKIIAQRRDLRSAPDASGIEHRRNEDGGKRDPERFFVPPYQGPFGWIGVRLDIEVDWSEVADLVEDSYRMSAPKKLLATLDS